VAAGRNRTRVVNLRAARRIEAGADWQLRTQLTLIF
jgi:hypothetical protein